jgi:hypothetical protein
MISEGEVKVIITGEETVTPAAQKTTNAIADLGTESTKTGGKIEELSGHGRELHRVASLMNHILPGSGEAIKGIAHSSDGTALALIGMVAVMEITIEAFHRMEAGAKAADESLAKSLSEGGMVNAINAQAKAWEDAELSQDQYFHNIIANEDDMIKRIADAQAEILKNKKESKEQELADEIAIREQELKIKQVQTGAVVADENSAAAKEKAAAGAVAKHDQLVKTYTDNIATAKEASQASGVTADDEQEIRQAYEGMTGKPGAGPGALDLGAQAEYVRNHIYTDTTGTLSGNLHIANLFSDFAGGRGLNDASFAAYELAQNDIRRNQTQLTSENGSDFDVRLKAQNSKDDLTAARKTQTELFASINNLTQTIQALKGIAPQFPPGTSSQPTVPYEATADGRARHDVDLLQQYQELLHHGGQLTDYQSRILDQILSVFNLHAKSSKDAVNMIDQLLANQSATDRAFEDIKKRITSTTY